MKKKEKPYAQKLIPLIIFMVVGYAIVDFILQFTCQMELSSTLTTCWFSFWGVEIISLASIKIGKSLKKPDLLEEEEEEEK